MCFSALAFLYLCVQRWVGVGSERVTGCDAACTSVPLEFVEVRYVPAVASELGQKCSQRVLAWLQTCACVLSELAFGLPASSATTSSGHTPRPGGVGPLGVSGRSPDIPCPVRDAAAHRAQHPEGPLPPEAAAVAPSPPWRPPGGVGAAQRPELDASRLLQLRLPPLQAGSRSGTSTSSEFVHSRSNRVDNFGICL